MMKVKGKNKIIIKTKKMKKTIMMKTKKMREKEKNQN